jgi:hypothetical protein
MAGATKRKVSEALTMTRSVFALRVRAERGIDAIRSLRAWLKSGLRNFGLRCLAIHEEEGGEFKMVSIKERYPKSGLLTAEDVEAGDLLLRIDYVVWDEIVSGKKRDVVYFTNDNRRLSLNQTNAYRIAKLYGNDGDQWRGCWITLTTIPMSSSRGRNSPASA